MAKAHKETLRSFAKLQYVDSADGQSSMAEVRFERAAYLGLMIPSSTVRLVENAKNRSPRLPTTCDACNETIGEYPFIAKHHRSYRKYHISCALRIALVLPTVNGSH